MLKTETGLWIIVSKVPLKIPARTQDAIEVFDSRGRRHRETAYSQNVYGGNPAAGKHPA